METGKLLTRLGLAVLMISFLTGFEFLSENTIDQKIDNINNTLDTTDTGLVAQNDISNTGAKLMIAETGYTLYLKPNPFSAQVTNIQAGDAMYILSTPQDGWYQVETLKHHSGFIKAKAIAADDKAERN